MKKLQNYLRWLIQPQNDEETKRFREQNLVDVYIEIEKRIPTMTEQELIDEINVQTKPYKLQIMETAEINILIDCVKQLKIIKERIENVNDEQCNNLNKALSLLDDVIQNIEDGE